MLVGRTGERVCVFVCFGYAIATCTDRELLTRTNNSSISLNLSACPARSGLIQTLLIGLQARVHYGE